jgi:hypothetical protein
MCSGACCGVCCGICGERWIERGDAVAGIPPIAGISPADVVPVDAAPVDAAPSHKKLPRKKPIDPDLKETHIATSSNLNRKQKIP